MNINILKSALLVLSVAVISSCNTEDPLTGITQTLDCDYFSQDRVLVDDPDAAIDYLITCDMAVNADITIMPGVTIAFATDAGIVIRETGSFKAEGTATQPITFTGQDAVKGSWRGVIVYSNDPKNIFDHCVIEHAGGIAHNSNGDRGAFIVWAEGRLSLTNSIIRQSASHGFNANYSDATLELGGNTITENDGAPLYIVYNYVDVPSSSDSYLGNAITRILVKSRGRTIKQSKTWRKVNVDYQVTEATSVTVSENGVLTIEPGISIYFDAGCQIHVNDQAALSAQGTEAQPISFKGTTAVNGSWIGLDFGFTDNALNSLQYVTIENAGGSGAEGAIYMWAQPKLTVQNSTIRNSGSCGFFAAATGDENINLTTNAVVFENNTGADYCID